MRIGEDINCLMKHVKFEVYHEQVDGGQSDNQFPYALKHVIISNLDGTLIITINICSIQL